MSWVKRHVKCYKRKIVIFEFSKISVAFSVLNEFLIMKVSAWSWLIVFNLITINAILIICGCHPNLISKTLENTNNADLGHCVLIKFVKILLEFFSDLKSWGKSWVLQQSQRKKNFFFLLLSSSFEQHCCKIWHNNTQTMEVLR